MKIKILCFCFITGFTVIAQVKLGTNTGTVATNANFQVEGTTVTDQFVVLKNANVGVGTNAPASKLHVVLGSGNGNLTAWDNTAATFGQNGTTGSAIGLGFDTTTNAAWISTITPATAWRPLNFLGNNWRFLTNGTTEVFSILNNGNIGIGVSAPAAQLHTTGTVRFAGAGTPAVGKVLTSDASGNATWTAPATSGTVTSVSGTLPITVATGTSTPAISIATANTTTTGAITGTDWTTFNNKIGSASNGLTTTSGDVKLGGTLTQATSITLSTTIDNLGIIRDVAGTSGESSNGYANLTIGGSGSGGNSYNTGGKIKLTGFAGTEAGTITGYEGSGQRIMSLKGGAATGTNGMYLLNSGNIGIGVEVPAAQLHTTGTVRFAGAGTPAVGKVLTSDASGNATWTAPASSGTVTSVTGTLPITVATGTSTPAISIATANTTTTGAITGSDWTTFNNKIGSASNGLTTTSGDVKLGGTFTQSTTIANAGFNLGITGTGNVGIGTSTPLTKLDVFGNSFFGIQNTVTGGNLSVGTNIANFSTPTVTATAAITTPETAIRLIKSGTTAIKYNASADLQLGTYGSLSDSQTSLNIRLANGATHIPDTNVMTLLGNGNVGIGVTAPTAQLETNGTVKFSGAGTPAAGKVLTSDASGNATWITPTSSGTVTSVTGTLPITVATGTSTPAISIATANTTTTGAITGTDWTTFNNKIGSASNGLTTTSGTVTLGGTLTQATTIANGGFNLGITGTGNVGIGTATPTSQLHTTGSVKFAGAGTPSVGRVLTSDATGLATWQTPSVAGLAIDTVTAAVPATVYQTVSNGSLQFLTTNTGVIMKSADGTNWMLTIENSGVITVKKVTP